MSSIVRTGPAQPKRPTRWTSMDPTCSSFLTAWIGGLVIALGVLLALFWNPHGALLILLGLYLWHKGIHND